MLSPGTSQDARCLPRSHFDAEDPDLESYNQAYADLLAVVARPDIGRAVLPD